MIIESILYFGLCGILLNAAARELWSLGVFFLLWPVSTLLLLAARDKSRNLVAK